MVNLILKISEQKRVESYNLEFNKVNEDNTKIEIKNYFQIVRLYTGNASTSEMNTKIIKLAERYIPKIHSEVYDLNRNEIEKYYIEDKRVISSMIDFEDSEEFEEFAQILKATSKPIGNCKECRLILDNYKEDKEYAYIQMELTYENGLYLHFEIQLAMNRDDTKGELVKFKFRN